MIAIDLGSNTIRVLHYDCNTAAKKAVFEKIVKTADKTQQSKTITQDAIDRVVAALNEAKEKLGFEGEDAVGVATAAFRMAKNADFALESIRAKTGVSFKLIDGETEAYLTALAVSTALEKTPIGQRSFMLADIGGGSTEIIFHKEGKMVAQSFEVGIIGLAQKYRISGDLERNIHQEMQQIRDFIKDCLFGFAMPELFCATAGTPTTLAALQLGMSHDDYDGKKINGQTITRQEAAQIAKGLARQTPQARARLVGTGREEFILAGAAIFNELFVTSGFNECTVFDDGLREGVAIATCRSIKF